MIYVIYNEDGEVLRTYSSVEEVAQDTDATNAVPVENSTFEASERSWRNAELSKYDLRSLLTDDPNNSAIVSYRQALRDWPSTDDFPNTRPTL